MDKLMQEIKQFNEERDWDQFHSPENLAKSIAIESGELLECFQWDNSFNKQDLRDELAQYVQYSDDEISALFHYIFEPALAVEERG